MTKPERVRLLDLFPIQAVRATWSAARGHSKLSGLRRVVEQVPESDIVVFARDNFGRTKQHVYLRRVTPKNPAAILANPLGDVGGLMHKESTSQRKVFFYLVPLRYRLLVAPPPRYEYLNFAWPILLTFEVGVARIGFTIMEKNLRAYFGDAPSVRLDQRSVDEEAILRRLSHEHAGACGFEPLDFNAGIKELLANDIVDSSKATFRKPKSLSMEVMDERFMIKANNPVVYDQMLKAPLLKTQFKYLTRDAPLTHFAADPTAGFLAFPSFSDHADAPSKVIEHILQRN